MHKRTIIIFITLIITYFICYTYYISVFKGRALDFKIYYFAAKAYEQNLNIYDTLTIGTLVQQGTLKNDSIYASELLNTSFGFVYPPITIKFFQVFSSFSYQFSLVIFNTLKLFLLLFLILIWIQFINIKKHIEFLIFVILAFHSTIGWDIYVGQVGIIEQIFIWLGFVFFLRQNYIWFIICIFLASVFKITPLFFIGLLIFINDKRKYHYFSFALVLGFIYIIINYLFDPNLFNEFIRAQSGHFQTNRADSLGLNHPSVIALLNSSFLQIFGPKALKKLSLLPYLIYFISSLVIVIISYKKIKKIRLKNEDNFESKKIIIFIFCFIYALVNPKFMFYSYILLLIPTFYIIQNTKIIKPFYLYLFIFILAKDTSYPIINQFAYLYNSYYPLILAFGVWILYIIEDFNVIDKNARKFQNISFIKLGGKHSEK